MRGPGRPALAVSEGAVFEGTLAFRGRARVDGRLAGEVIASGALEIGERAEVRGRVEADELVVAGRLEGDAVIRRRIELLASARVVGDLRAPTLVLADGCRVRGRLDTAPGGPTGGVPAHPSP